MITFTNQGTYHQKPYFGKNQLLNSMLIDIREAAAVTNILHYSNRAVCLPELDVSSPQQQQSCK
jgi:hypothetical protein